MSGAQMDAPWGKSYIWCRRKFPQVRMMALDVFKLNSTRIRSLRLAISERISEIPLELVFQQPENEWKSFHGPHF